MLAMDRDTRRTAVAKRALALVAILAAQSAVNAQTQTPEETSCHDRVQNKVAWNPEGQTAWNDANVRSLCRGVTSPEETYSRINCFARSMPSVGWSEAIERCTASVTPQPPQAFDLSGSWTMYEAGGKRFDKSAVVAQTGTSVRLDNGYGSLATGTLDGGKLVVRPWKLTGTVTAAGSRIEWSSGVVWEKSPAATAASPATVARTVTIKNSSGFRVYGSLSRLDSSNVSRGVARTKGGAGNGFMGGGASESIGGDVEVPVDDLVELTLHRSDATTIAFSSVAFFRAVLPRGRDVTTFCYEVTGTIFDAAVKACSGGPTYEARQISFNNEAGFASTMALTYYPLGKTTTSSVTTHSTTAGYRVKLHLPLDADTARPMSLKITKDGFPEPVLTRTVTVGDFDRTCYKVWGSFVTAKVSPCTLDPNARTVKLWNNSGYTASVVVTYYDRDGGGGDVARTVRSNPLEVTQTDTIEVPRGTSPTPVKIGFINHWKNGVPFTTMTAPAGFAGGLCYKVEGTAFAPTAATCDDTVGDTTGPTRQIRFQNEAGFDAQMVVTCFVDEVINGQKMAMPKTITTGLINGLGGKFRMVTIPEATSAGLPVTVALQGSATVKNEVWSTTLPADFRPSPQPCFKVWGTLFDPHGGKCDQ